MLIGNANLKKTVDQINKNRTAEDIELSKILIEEQKKIRQKKKMLQIFDEDSDPENQLGSNENKDKIETKKSVKSSKKKSVGKKK